MATPDDHKSSFPDDVYQDVKDWAAKQEAFEKENKAPAPLTDVQRMFLESFRPRPPLPDISQLDYISLLHSQCHWLKKPYIRYADRNDPGYRQANPTGKVITFADRFFEIRTAEGIPSPQWTCTVELSEALASEPAINSFPAAGFGLDTTGSCPSFAKKKDAQKCMLSLLA